MPTCRLCFSVYPREQFIHGIGPKAQVCVRCGLERGLVTEEEVASLYNKSTANARFSALARRWSPLMWLSVLWIVWIVLLNEVDPWGLYTLILLALFTLVVPLYMFFFSSKHMPPEKRFHFYQIKFFLYFLDQFFLLNLINYSQVFHLC